jgi:hypothetical protein
MLWQVQILMGMSQRVRRLPVSLKSLQQVLIKSHLCLYMAMSRRKLDGIKTSSKI